MYGIICSILLVAAPSEDVNPEPPDPVKKLTLQEARARLANLDRRLETKLSRLSEDDQRTYRATPEYERDVRLKGRLSRRCKRVN